MTFLVSFIPYILLSLVPSGLPDPKSPSSIFLSASHPPLLSFLKCRFYVWENKQNLSFWSRPFYLIWRPLIPSIFLWITLFHSSFQLNKISLCVNAVSLSQVNFITLLPWRATVQEDIEISQLCANVLSGCTLQSNRAKFYAASIFSFWLFLNN